jgi:hypothetical protein
MKNLTLATIRFGNEWLWWLLEKTIEKLKQARDWVIRKFNEYFIKKDLSKDELQS